MSVATLFLIFLVIALGRSERVARRLFLLRSRRLRTGEKVQRARPWAEMQAMSDFVRRGADGMSLALLRSTKAV
jgi:hypothetical protein